jgi:PEP-CTERM motif
VSNPTGEFTSSAYPKNGLSLFGSVRNGDAFDLSFDLIITSADFAYNLFAVTETPSVASVPEPATIALAGLGLGRRRRTC